MSVVPIVKTAWHNWKIWIIRKLGIVYIFVCPPIPPIVSDGAVCLHKIHYFYRGLCVLP